MPFPTAAGSGEFHYLVEMFLDSTTLRLADEDLCIQTNNSCGFFYQGRLPQSGVLSRDLGTFLEAKETINTFDVVADNRDGTPQKWIRDYVFANREVRVWIGEGISKNRYSEVFRGFVVHPNGVRWDEEEAAWTVIDKRIKDRKFLPPNNFNTTDYPNIELKSKNAKRPIVYGDWRSTAQGGLTIPVVCANTATLQFKIADHGLHSIERYLKNAVVLTASQIKNVSLTAATFQLSGVAYNVTSDTISVNCRGLKTIGGTLIEAPGKTKRSIYTTWLGLTTADLDVTAFNDIDTETSPDKIRRFINTETSSEVLIAELLGESGTDMRFVRGKYSPKFRSMDLASEQTHFREDDIILSDERKEKAEFTVERDPMRFYANKIRARYNYDPVNEQYDGVYTKQVTSAVAQVSATVERLMDFHWYYDQSITQTRVDRELMIFTKEPLNIQITVGRRGILANLADQFKLTYNIFADRTVQIRRIDTDLGQMTTRISGFNLFMLGMGRWTNDSAPNWNNASATQRAEQGSWCNTAGYASASDSTSLNVSRWF